MAADEVSGPLIAGTLTTVLVFGPIVFVQGLAAALFRDLSLAVVTSLSASLILALTLMPVMMVGAAARGEPSAAPCPCRPRAAALARPWAARTSRWPSATNAA